MPLLSKLPRTRTTLLAVLFLLAILAWFATPAVLGSKVTTLPVTQGELTQTVVASGKVRSPQRVELSSQISGRVAQIPVAEGQPVQAGQLLIQIDDAELRAALRQAQAQLAQSEGKLAQIRQLALPLALQTQRQAEANLTQAQQQFARTEALVTKGFYSRVQLDDAQRNLNVAQSQWQAAQLQSLNNQEGGADVLLARTAVDQARASLQVAESRLAYASITAPLPGTILTRSVERGDTAQPGKVLMTLSPAGSTELVAQIDEKNLRLLKLGQKALASADAYPDQRFAAELVFIGASIDPLRGSVEVRLRVPDAPAYLLQEMTVSVDIETARRASALVAPLDGIRDSNSAEPWALVVRDGVATRQPVRIGLRGDGKVEILEGVAKGELLVPAKLATVREGKRVRAVTD